MKLSIRIGLLIAILVTASTACWAGEIRIASFNTRFLFKPGNTKAGGQIDHKGPKTLAQYEQKVANVARICSEMDLVSLQELGSDIELSDVGSAAGMKTLFKQGRDTYTGEDVGILYRLPNDWSLDKYGRVPELDRVVSKHLLAEFDTPQGRVAFLVFHLLRPLGQNEQKHQRQVDAIAKWASATLAQDTTVTIILAGDTNNTTTAPIFGVGTDSGEILGWSNTMVSDRRLMPIDRIVVAGVGRLAGVDIFVPPIGRRPNDLNQTLWSDHCALLALVQQ